MVIGKGDKKKKQTPKQQTKKQKTNKPTTTQPTNTFSKEEKNSLCRQRCYQILLHNEHGIVLPAATKVMHKSCQLAHQLVVARGSLWLAASHACLFFGRLDLRRGRMRRCVLQEMFQLTHAQNHSHAIKIAMKTHLKPHTHTLTLSTHTHSTYTHIQTLHHTHTHTHTHDSPRLLSSSHS